MDRLGDRRSDRSHAAPVVAEGRAKSDLFERLRRIGIDEIFYKKGHKHLTVVVDHDTGRLLWAKPGREWETLEKFVEELGPERSALIRLVSAVAGEWIAVELYHRILTHRPTIEATLAHGLSNALVESANTNTRVLTRIAYGFKNPDGLIALALLDRGGYCPPLPGCTVT